MKIKCLILVIIVVLPGCSRCLSENEKASLLGLLKYNEELKNFKSEGLGAKINKYSDSDKWVHTNQGDSYEILIERCDLDLCYPDELVDLLEFQRNGAYRFVSNHTEAYSYVVYPKVCFSISIYFDKNDRIVGWSYFE